MKVLLIENQIHGNGTSIVIVHKILSRFELGGSGIPKTFVKQRKAT